MFPLESTIPAGLPPISGAGADMVQTMDVVDNERHVVSTLLTMATFSSFCDKDMKQISNIEITGREWHVAYLSLQLWVHRDMDMYKERDRGKIATKAQICKRAGKGAKSE